MRKNKVVSSFKPPSFNLNLSGGGSLFRYFIKNNQFFLLSLFMFVSFLGCQTKNSQNKTQLNIEDTLSFDVSKMNSPRWWRSTTINDTNFITVYSLKQKAIYFYLPKQEQSIKKISIEHPYTYIADYSVLSKDSIFMLPLKAGYYKNLIVLTNEHGELINKWKIPDSILPTHDLAEPYIDHNFPFYYKNKTLYASLGGLEHKGFSEIILNLQTHPPSKIGLAGKFPSKTRIGNFFNPTRTINHKQQFVYNFPSNDTLYLYKNDSLLNKISVKSRFKTTSSTYPVKYEKYYKNKKFKKYKEAQKKYYKQTFSYEYIIYDKYRNLYYRIATLPISLKDNEGLQNKYKDKPVVIMVLNTDFEILGEIKLPGKQFVATPWIFVTPKGLCINANHPQNPIYEPEKFKFVVFKPENIKSH